MIALPFRAKTSRNYTQIFSAVRTNSSVVLSGCESHWELSKEKLRDKKLRLPTASAKPGVEQPGVLRDMEVS